MNWTRRAFLGACGLSIAAAQNRKRPNILFILTDDHHFQAAGYTGNPHIQTPQLDALAKKGMVFTQAISASPQTAPSRGVLLTGQEPYKTGVTSNGARKYNVPVGPSIMEQLQASGYETSLIGKWQALKPPSALGFTNAPLWIQINDAAENYYFLSRGVPAQETVKVDNSTEAFTQAAIEYLAQPHEKPFFLWLSYLHEKVEPRESPFLALYAKTKVIQPPPLHDKNSLPFNWRRYYATISHLDDSIGKVLAALEKSAELADTIIFFAGANGSLSGSHERTGKILPWEASLRVPMLVAGPGVQSGAKSDAPVSTADLPATWLDFAQVKPVSPLAGRSLKVSIETGKAVTDESYSSWCDLKKENSQGAEPYRVIRTRTHKLVLWQSGTVELYDWPADPEEKRNLAADPSSQKVLGLLKRKLEAQMADRKDPMLAKPTARVE